MIREEARNLGQAVRSVAGAIKEDCTEAWEASRPDQPQESVIDEWRKSKQLTFGDPMSIDVLGVRAVWCANVLWRKMHGKRERLYATIDFLGVKAEKRLAQAKADSR